jgi:hypothetical protein
VGCFHGGKKVLAVLRLPTQYEVGGTDPVQGRILIVNTHDGSGTIFGTYVNRRLFCDNQIPSLKAKSFFRIRHTASMGERLEHARQLVVQSRNAHREFCARAEALEARGLTRHELPGLFEALFDATWGKPEDADGFERRRDVTRYWAALWHHRTNSNLGDNYWRALNAVTYWHEHVRSRVNEHSNLLGRAGRDKQLAMDVLCQHAGVA